MRKSLTLFPLLLAACVAETEIPEGRDVFVQDCATCHGNDAKGKGPLMLSVGQVARDLTLVSSCNGGVFPMQAVMATIDG